MLQKSPCNLQELFWCPGFLPATCRRLSGVPESFLQIAGNFQMFPKPSCRSRGGFGKQMTGCNSN